MTNSEIIGKEIDELIKKGNEVVNYLMESLHKVLGEEVNYYLLRYIVARFTASNILLLQDYSENSNYTDDFFKLIKNMMLIMGKDKDKNMQSLMDSIDESIKEIADIKNKAEKKINVIDELEKQQKELLEKIGNSKENLN